MFVPRKKTAHQAILLYITSLKPPLKIPTASHRGRHGRMRRDRREEERERIAREKRWHSSGRYWNVRCIDGDWKRASCRNYWNNDEWNSRWEDRQDNLYHNWRITVFFFQVFWIQWSSVAILTYQDIIMLFFGNLRFLCNKELRTV